MSAPGHITISIPLNNMMFAFVRQGEIINDLSVIFIVYFLSIIYKFSIPYKF
jgi:hypothetical protein